MQILEKCAGVSILAILAETFITLRSAPPALLVVVGICFSRTCQCWHSHGLSYLVNYTCRVQMHPYQPPSVQSSRTTKDRVKAFPTQINKAAGYVDCASALGGISSSGLILTRSASHSSCPESAPHLQDHRGMVDMFLTPLVPHISGWQPWDLLVVTAKHEDTRPHRPCNLGTI